MRGARERASACRSGSAPGTRPELGRRSRRRPAGAEDGEATDRRTAGASEARASRDTRLRLVPRVRVLGEHAQLGAILQTWYTKMPNPEYSNHLKVRSKARSSSCFKLIGNLTWGRVRVDPGVAGGGRPRPDGRLSPQEAGVGGARRRAAALDEARSSGGAAIGRWGERDGEPREERASAASCALAAQPRQYSRTYKSAGVAAPAPLRSAIPSLVSRAKMRSRVARRRAAD